MAARSVTTRLEEPSQLISLPTAVIAQCIKNKSAHDSWSISEYIEHIVAVHTKVLKREEKHHDTASKR